MTRKRLTSSWWPIATLVILAVVLASIALLWPKEAPAALPEPTRVPVPSAPATEPPATSEPIPEVTLEPVQVGPSNILRVNIATVGLDVKVSGPTEPRETENCKGGTVLCIDPPVPDQAAWYGTVPMTESEGSVRLFGHTSENDPAYAAFNSLVAVIAGDLIVVETETGIFTYRAEAPSYVPYVDVPNSELIWGNAPDRLVLVTCNNEKASGTVVEAWLVDVTPR